ncbi:MAG: CHASE2 domain-containing protein [Cyanobacteriota bacterium]|nr:CHASE2 domain-containing protein [Cyanobacteriota bacterium]
MNSNCKEDASKTQSPSPSSQSTQRQETTKTLAFSFLGRGFQRDRWSYWVVGLVALVAAIATAGNGKGVQLLERQLQTLLTRLRPKVAPPAEIVIVAIDDTSLGQYARNPRLHELETLQHWPWKREAYAIAMERLLEAGAKAVALDVILAGPSLYGEADDARLQKVLQAYPQRIVLAAMYEEDTLRPGALVQLVKPDPGLRTPSLALGSINYPLEEDNRIHRLAEVFPRQWANNNPDLASEFYEFVATIPSFSRATLQAADLSYPKSKGENIFYYGPPNTFEQIPFADILDSENWNSYLQKGEYFRNKIVLIGPTSEMLKDFHPTPVSEQMAGVEVQANAIATLLEGKILVEVLPNGAARGLFVFAIVFGLGIFISRRKQGLARAGWTVGGAIAFLGLSYLAFVGGRIIVPVAIPVAGIVLGGSGSAAVGALEELWRKRNLRQTIKYYASSPIVQEIIAQDEDLKDILEERDREILSATLGGRYKVLRKLSAGGFGETYIALDLQRPGTPTCVIKQLRPASNNPKHWEIAKRFLAKEAEILERLGKHDRIPQLLAYFEEGNEFYLIEEFIEGCPLSHELAVDVPFSQGRVGLLLWELLSILDFIHQRGAIHRDIKPGNIIRRAWDGKLVLIDFGAVKERTQSNEAERVDTQTIAIGSRGYAPREQALGNPQFNSDIYAAGMVAIRALTLCHPAKLKEDPDTGEIVWEDRANVSAAFAAIVNKMIRSNFRDRYQSVSEVLADLNPFLQNLHSQEAPLRRESPIRAEPIESRDSPADTEPETATLPALDEPFSSEGETAIAPEANSGS